MKTIFLLLTLATLPAAAQTGAKLDTLTMPKAGGGLLTFKNCTVTKVEPDGVRITHEDGSAKIPYEHLPEALKKVFQFDSDAAKAFRDKAAVAAAENPNLEPEQVDPLPLEIAGQTGKLVSKEEVLAAWIKQANPDAVSSLYDDPKTKTKVGGITQRGRKIEFIGDAKLSDAQKLKNRVEKHRDDLISGKHDKAAHIASLTHNLDVYQLRGDTANAEQCAEQLRKLKRPPPEH